MKRVFSLLLCLCLTVGLFSACSAKRAEAPTEEPTQDTHELTPATEAPVQSDTPFGLAYVASYGLNPYKCTCITNRPIISLLYESLFVLNNRYEPEPVLCDKFASTDNGKTYVVTLREGITFSDGTALTAQDAVSSLKAAMGSDYYGDRFRLLSDVSATDERTLRFTLLQPHENLPLLLDVPIVKAGTTEDTVPIGSGPYRMGDGVLERNRTWWQDAALPVDAAYITLSELETPTQVRDSFEFGATSLVCVDLNSPAAVGYRCDYELWDCPTTTMQYLGFNLSAGICADPVFRAAITHVIDRDKLIADLYKGFGEAACLPCAPSSPLYDAKLAAQYGYDPDLFASALKRSGVRTGYTGTLLVCSADTTRVELAHRIAEALEAYGLKITVNAVDAEHFLYNLRIGNFDMYLGQARLSGTFDLSEFFRPYGTLGYGGLTNFSLDGLCTDALENSGNYYELHRRIMDDGYLCPLLFKSYAVMANRGAISNLQSGVDCVFRLPGGRTLADATVAYEVLVPSAAPEESESAPE